MKKNKNFRYRIIENNNIFFIQHKNIFGWRYLREKIYDRTVNFILYLMYLLLLMILTILAIKYSNLSYIVYILIFLSFIIPNYIYPPKLMFDSYNIAKYYIDEFCD